MNELTIDLDKLDDVNVAQYSYMKMIYYKRGGDVSKTSGISEEDIKDLIVKEYIDQSLNITLKYVNKFENRELREQFNPGKDLEAFVEKYRSIFPTGSNAAGYPYKGDKQGCIKKMRSFKRKHPEYSEDLIIKVTKDYVNSQFFKGYTYMQTAAYLIEKDGNSNLAALCEAALNMTKRSNRNSSFEEDL